MVALAKTNSGTIDLANATTNWVGDTFSLEPDIKVEGSDSVSCAQTNNGTNDIYVSGSWNFSSSQHIRLFWNIAYVGNMATTNPVQIFLYDGTNTDYFNIITSNGDYAGGWLDLLVAVNSTNFPTVTLSSITRVGIRVNTASKPRNQPANAWFDNWRYSDGLTITSTTTEAVSFQDAADQDATDENFVFNDVDGILFAGCELLLGGTGSENANIVSSNEVIVFPSRNVTGSLYKLKTQEGTGNTDIDISGLVCKTVGGTGAELDISSSLNSLSITSSSFIDMGTITLTPTVTSPTFDGNSFTNCGATTIGIAVTGCNWITSGQVTQNGTSSITGCTFDRVTAATTLAINDISAVSGNTFISDGSNYAVDLGTISTSTSLTWNNTLSGYAGSDGSTGNEAIKVNYTDTGSPLTILVSGGSTPSVHNTGAGTVTVSAAKDVTLTGLQAGSEIHAYVGAQGSGATEIGTGIESSGTSYTFSQSVSGQAGYIVIIEPGYAPLTIRLTYSGDNQTIPVQQIGDNGAYNNP